MPGCASEDNQFDGRSPAYKRALIAVITINGAMFLVEVFDGFLACSQALKADALDFAGDTATYALSLAVIGSSLHIRSTAAPVMSGIGFLALAANVLSVLILLRWRDGDSNIRSVWLCSRNDAIGNVAVIGAGAAVWATGSFWPDLIVAAMLAGLFTKSLIAIVTQALHERRASLNLAEKGA